MAISFGGISSRGATSLTIPSGTSPLLIAMVFNDDSSLLFGSQSMVLLGTLHGPASNYVQVWYLTNPVTGSSETFTGSPNNPIWSAYYYGAGGMQAFQSIGGTGDGNPVDLFLNNNYGGFTGSEVWGFAGGYDGVTTFTASGWSQRATFSSNSQFWYDSNGPLPSGINTLAFSTVNSNVYMYTAAFILPYQPPATTTPGSFLLNMI